jgi:hypothetical protein
MKKGACSKRYPKVYADDSTIDRDGFPVYRRREDGRTVKKGVHTLDNLWVVPHNIRLLKKNTRLT